ncbi:hypothetical protein [Acidithiobacillus ferridurans]|uniref:hypothetical protein n=2 Tax=Acidithiobacillus ferridurans TaxID=1232575 RepID=UPI001C07370F|nr:hypothetical protein [Acidithiobacillus ferridurans]MBU2716944.1 hypothetical protein [Acidithiobacillus ferridurans]MBU2725667.1 hypothetical protein [Acidithiobacillus ferridurans]
MNNNGLLDQPNDILRLWINLELLDFPDFPDGQPLRLGNTTYTESDAWSQSMPPPWQIRKNMPSAEVRIGKKVLILNSAVTPADLAGFL